MRYIELISRNVFIPKQFQQKLTQFKQECQHDNAKHWVDTVFRRFMINYYDAMPIRSTSPNYPSWVNENIKQGKEVLQLSDISLDELLHYADFLNTLPSTKDLTRMSFTDFSKKITEWEHSFKQNNTEEDGIHTVFKIKDYTWVEVTGRNSLKREGSLMNHCVGGYFEKVQNGTTKIYSLRDAANKPHVTVEFNTRFKEIRQLKGNSNKPINPKYLPYVIPFLNELNFKEVNGRDLSYNNMVRLDDRVYRLSDVPKNSVLADIYYKKGMTLPKNVTIKYLEVLQDNITLKDFTVSVLDVLKSTISIQCKLTKALYADQCNITEIPSPIKANLEFYTCTLPSTIKNVKGARFIIDKCKNISKLENIECMVMQLISCDISTLVSCKVELLEIHNCPNLDIAELKRSMPNTKIEEK